MKKILFFSLVIGLALFAAPTLAAEWYIDADTGSDNMQCTQAVPCFSMGWVITNLMSGGDTVYLKGTFTADIFYDFNGFSGTALNPTVITNWDGYSPTLVIQEGVDTFQFSSDYFEFRNITFTGNGTLVNATPISMSADVKNNVISGCTFEDSGAYGINANGPISDFEISNNTFSNNNEAIFFLSTATDTVIKNNFINTSGTSAITFTNAATDIDILNNTFVENREIVSFIGNMGSNLVYKNNIAVGLDGELNGIRDGSGINVYLVNLTSDNNIFYMGDDDWAFTGTEDYTLATWQQSAFGQDANSLGSNPLLVSVEPGSEDPHLQSTSPAIDAGATVAAVTDDIDGDSRPYGSAYDIGADENLTPDAPTAAVLTNRTSSTATISWTASTKDIDGYTFTYSDDINFASYNDLPDTTSTSINVTGLDPETTYYYRLAAYHVVKETEYKSDFVEDSFTTLAEDEDDDTDYSPAKKIKNLKVKKSLRKKKKATATWKKNKYATTIKLQKWNKKSKKYKKKRTIQIKKNKKKKVIKKLKPDTKYRIRARKRRTVDNAYYYSAWTKWVKFRTKK